MDGVAEVKVDWQTGTASVTTRPGVKLDEQKARALIDKDYKLTSCVEITN